jgi:glucose/arabinose dehydrogenase
MDCGAMPSGQAPALKLTPVVSGLDRPVFVTAAPGDTDRLFVVEHAGAIRIVESGSVLPTPFLDLEALISVPSPNTEEEFGVLGLAFHPDYAQNGRFFVFYVSDIGDSVVVEYRRSAGNPDVADPTQVQTLATLTGGGGKHYGGMLAFGKDGYLYIASGDRDGEEAGQNTAEARAKILRIDADAPATPPPGNMQGGHPLAWSYGLRNPWRFSVDRCSGDLYIGDVGGVYEEVNVQPAGEGHQNYGWPVIDVGAACPLDKNCDGITLPVWAIDHGLGDCSMVAGYVYRGSAIPNMNGRFIFGDYCNNKIRSFVWTGGPGIALEEDLTENLASTSTLGELSSFGEDNEGNLYVVDLDGAIFRIDAE